jgi:branched-chain amino acid transport system ATP-binding protein
MDGRSGAPRSTAAAARPKPEALLADGICVRFDGLTAVDDVSLTIKRSEIVGLIGPNGAGKTTLVNALSGFQRPTSGQVFLDDLEVTGMAPVELARRGLTRTFQAVRIFGDLSVYENVEAAALSTVRRRAAAVPRVLELLRWVDLADRSDQLASTLPYGDERRLGLARALATQPAFLLLDEPAAGLNEVESQRLMEVILRIRDEHGCGVLVIEHHMPLIMKLCERVHVLNYGKTISEGAPAAIQADPVVIEAYLGSGRTVSRNDAASR